MADLRARYEAWREARERVRLAWAAGHDDALDFAHADEEHLDVTSGDEHANGLMERYRIAGVPTYLLLGPDGIERRRLVGFIPAADMLQALQAVGNGTDGSQRG